MSKLDELKSLLQSKNLWARKGLGQNFLVDEKALDKIVEAAELSKSDQVIEVGPGTGFLTERLIEKAGQVLAVELDFNMVYLLKDRFESAKNLKVIEGDILKLAVPEILKRGQNEKGAYKVVANIPYYITSPVIKHFLQAERRPSLIILLVQKEVAEKICGRTGKTVLTVETEVYGKPELILKVHSSAFYPAPKVDSAVLKIQIYDEPLIPFEQMDAFMRIVKFGYSQKRKKLSNSLSAGLRIENSKAREFIVEAVISPEVRAEELEIEDWKRLTEVLTNHKY